MSTASQIELSAMEGDVSHSSLHTLVDVCKADENSPNVEEPEPIEAIFGYELRKTFWYSFYEETMEKLRSSKEVDDEKREYIRTVYKVNMGMDILVNNKISIPIPAVSLLDKHHKDFRIAWTPNVGVNSVVKSIFMVDGITLNTLDTGAIDNHMKWAVPHSQNNIRDFSIGSTPSLCSWSTSLPRKNCVFTIPFFYTYGYNSAFPLYLLNSQSDVLHILDTWQSPIQELLRVECRADGKTWKKWPKENYSNVLVSEKLTPVTWSCEYAMTTNEQKDQNRDFSSLGIQFHDFITFKVNNSSDLNSTAGPVQLKSADPVLAIFWNTVNINAETENNKTNYSTNQDDLYNGHSPAIYSTLKYGDVTKFRVTEDDMKSITQLKKFPNVPTEPGYCVHAFSGKPFGIDGHTGVIFHNDLQVNLTCRLASPSSAYLTNTSEKQAKNTEDIVSSVISSLAESSSGSSLGIEGESPIKNTYRTEARLLVWREIHLEKQTNGTYKISVV